MAKREYEWEPGQPPPTLYVHSVRKHEVLDAYISRYVKILNSRPHIDTSRLTLVDGFAGGGLYLHEQTRELTFGSPFIFLQATQQALAEINFERRKPFTLDAHYFFVERNPQVLQYLRQALTDQDYGPLIAQERIRLLLGEFSAHAPEIIRSIKKKGRSGRSIFLLDQYGYKDVPFPLLQQIFQQLPHAEVVLTFAIDALSNFLSNTETSRQIIERLGIKRPIDLELIARSKKTADRRAIIQRIFSSILREESGAEFYTPFFISSREDNRDYWLVHLSMHVRARDEMARLHWELKNHFKHSGDAGLNMFGYEPDLDPLVTGQALFADFNFEEQDHQRSVGLLREQLMEIIHRHPSGISFKALLEITCNTTPASSDLYKDALGQLMEESEIILSPQRQKGSSIQNEDVIRKRAKQLVLL
jgi:three-Cys-motif partner protein